MRSFFTRGALLLSSLLVAVSAASSKPESKLILPADFAPPQVFRNTNLLRTIDLTRPYSREVIVVIVENVSGEEQSQYFLPFGKDAAEKVSYIEARDKKGHRGEFEVSKAEADPERYTSIIVSRETVSDAVQIVPYSIAASSFRSHLLRASSSPSSCLSVPSTS
jgi:oligosaccharyltransferase complex subunit alpha (ribophorin I)